MKTPVIKCENLTKIYKLGETNVQALRGVSFELYAGTYSLLLGPSGCGKSTLLSLVAGLDVPTAGKIFIRGEDLSGLTVDQLAKHRNKKIGMIFQQFNLIQSMTVWENVALPYVFAGMPLLIRKKRAMKLLELVHMEKYANHLPTQLSGGQQQKVAIVRSLMNNPWILLIDEPTGNLDSISANEVMEFIRQLNEKSKRTILLVTHNPDYCKYAQRIMYMKDGKILSIEGGKAPETKETRVKADELSEEALEKM
ncbi:MAG: ABC transporter ATP-binding protein [Patescibacteria group bacterium]|nr:ABC transporter ATP-binding protein [Patescibacteria group bacterium]